MHSYNGLTVPCDKSSAFSFLEHRNIMSERDVLVSWVLGILLLTSLALSYGKSMFDSVYILFCPI